MLKLFYGARFFNRRSVIKMLSIITLIPILLLICSQQASARFSPQGITIDIKNESVNKVFREIKKQTGYTFRYTETMMKEAKKVSIDLNNSTLQKALFICFTTQPFGYKIINHTVVVQPKEKVEVNTGSIKTLPSPPPIEIHGRVVNQQGQPLQNVSVLIVGTQTGTTTDSDGRFTLTALNNKNITIEISSVGYQTKRVNVGKQTEINITLESVATGLSDVVVVGYGVQKKVDVTGAISSVKGADLRQSPAANLSNSIAGRIPGVIINNRSGEPGQDASTILIRGKGSLNDNSPLIVIDGVANIGGFDRLNPDDIESITVLKDASAAIYGAQAANGVILVTTKRGEIGEPRITYNGSYGITQPTRLPKLINAWQYATYRNEIDNRNGVPPEFTAEQIQNYKDGNDPLNFPNTDWLHAVVKNLSPQTRHSLSLRGGSKKISYFVSGGYLYQDGIFHNSATYYNQYNLRSNIDANITKNFKVSFDMSGRLEDRHYSNVPGYSIFGYSYGTFPTLPDYYPNGLPGAGVEVGRNPVLMASGATGYQKVKDYYVESRLSFELKMPYITEGLSVSGFASYDFRFNTDKTLNDNWDAYSYVPATNEYINYRNSEGPINLTEGFRDFNFTTYNVKLGYEHSFGENNISAFVAYEQSESFDEGINAYRTGYLTDQIDQISLGGNTGLNNSGTAFQSARQNVFGRATYNFKEKYLAEFILRHDGSFKFPKGQRWGNFPGVSVGWRISEEPFFKNHISFVNQLKLKASWGRLGNDKISPYQAILEYNTDAGYYFGPSSDRVAGLSLGVVPNPNITWEVADTKNIGIESSLLNGNLGISGDYFFSKRTNILLPRNASIPTSTGFTSSNLPDENIGIVDSHGYELQISYQRTVKKDLSFNIGVNFTHATNKVVYMDEAAKIPVWQKIQGHPMDSWLLYKSDGIYQTQAEIDHSPHLAGTKPGDIRYIDVNGDGNITSNDQVRVYESATPLNSFGIPMTINYKGIGLNILWQGQAKAKQFILPTFNPLTLPVWMYKDRWTIDNPNGKMPASFAPNNSINTLQSDFWLKNAAFVRLKTLELSYTFPKEMVSHLNLQYLNLYLSAFNLFTISKIKNYDPELSTSSGGYYPQTKVFNVGLRISL